MGVKCKLCRTDNGITQYHGKKCKKCGEVLMEQSDWNKCLKKNVSEFDIISDSGLIGMTRDKLNLIRSLVDEAQRLTVNMGFIEHHGEIRVKVAEIKPILKEIEKRFAKEGVDAE